MVMQETLGQYLKRLRGRTTLGDFAGRYNISLRCLQLLEEDNVRVHPVLLRQLAEIYEVSFAEMFERAGYQ